MPINLNQSWLYTHLNLSIIQFAQLTRQYTPKAAILYSRAFIILLVALLSLIPNFVRPRRPIFLPASFPTLSRLPLFLTALWPIALGIIGFRLRQLNKELGRKLPPSGEGDVYSEIMGGSVWGGFSMSFSFPSLWSRNLQISLTKPLDLQPQRSFCFVLPPHNILSHTFDLSNGSTNLLVVLTPWYPWAISFLSVPLLPLTPLSMAAPALRLHLATPFDVTLGSMLPS